MNSGKTVLTKGILLHGEKLIFKNINFNKYEEIFEINNFPGGVILSSDNMKDENRTEYEITNFLSSEDAIDLANHIILGSHYSLKCESFDIQLEYDTPSKLLIDNMNNFRIKKYGDHVLFSVGLNMYMSTFVLDVYNVLDIANSIIKYALYDINRTKVEDNLEWCNKILREDLEKGNIEEIQIRYHSKSNPYDPEDKLNHVFNVYPIYKHGLKNNYFNFNIIYDFGNIRKGTPEEIARELFHINYFDEIYKANSEEEQELIDKLREINPFIISGYTPVKIKFINCGKLFRKDKEYVIKLVEKEKEEQMEKLRNFNPEQHKKDMEEVKKIVDSVPRKEDGSLDFSSIISVFMQKEDE